MQQGRQSPRQAEDQINSVAENNVHVEGEGEASTTCKKHVIAAPLLACNEAQEDDAAGTCELHQSSQWWAGLRSIGKKYRSINLENRGSVARDHLALERTFLAWLRTSLAFASIGIAITQFFRLSTTRNTTPVMDYTETILIFNDITQRISKLGKPLGMTFIGISMVTLLLGSNRYFECQKWIIRGKFPACRGSVIIMVVMTFALMVTSLFVILLELNK